MTGQTEFAASPAGPTSMRRRSKSPRAVALKATVQTPTLSIIELQEGGEESARYEFSSGGQIIVSPRDLQLCLIFIQEFLENHHSFWLQAETKTRAEIEHISFDGLEALPHAFYSAYFCQKGFRTPCPKTT